jgi:PncC family amidohydrolase
MQTDQELAAGLRELGFSLALAESCTGGMIAARITALAGSSAYFHGGVVAYSNQVKAEVLQVPQALLLEHGAVSEPVAQAMAEGVRALMGSDLALSVTGIAGPDGGTAEKPVGTVFLALVDQRGCQVEQLWFAGDRHRVRQQTVDQAIIMLKKRLEALKRS